MLLIRCPYCEEERPELEFRNAGEAHIARPANIAVDQRRRLRKVLLHPLQPEGDHLRALAARAWLRALLQRRARHGHRQILAVYKAGEPKPDVEKLASSEPAAYANRPPDQLNVKKPRRAPAKKKDA